MTNKKRNTIITIILVILIFLTAGIIFTLNYSKDDTSLTVLEKKWITDNINKMIDVDVYNDIPVFGYNGEGMIFDFLNYTTKEANINFNKISYYTTSKKNLGDISFMVLNNSEKIEKQDIILYEDYYACLSLEKEKTIDFTKNIRLGYLEEDEKILIPYFTKPVELTAYSSIEQLSNALKNNEIDSIVLPTNKYMDSILKNNWFINYHLTDLKLNYTLRVKDETIYNILKKTYLEYLKNEYNDSYHNNYLKTYFTSTSTSSVEQKNYNAKSYKYGYVVNMPYENNNSNEFVGTISNYLEDFDKVANTDIEVVRYNSIDDLKSALISNEIDFALANFSNEKLNMDKYLTAPIKNLDYVILSKQNYVMNSIKGLKNYHVMTVSGSLLDELCKENEVDTNAFANTDELLRNIDDNSIILLDKQTYIYYKDTKLKTYKINYESTILNGYKFIMNSANKTFNQLFDYYINNMNYEQIKYLYKTSITIDKDYTTIKVFIFLLILLLALALSLFFLNKKNLTNKLMSKEEILKYIDPMTSLKNRSYLNLNIYSWDENVIFPQSVVVLDLNHIKEVNDKLGREAGDEIIKKTASILINNQLENTDIIRSGGDEFLIYMVGYEEKKVSDYTKRLAKLMKDIPNSLGVEIGYSMITDEVKTVDDAINEAILMMMKNKEKRK